MYALFVLSVHVYYVNGNAKTHMSYLCALLIILGFETYRLIQWSLKIDSYFEPGSKLKVSSSTFELHVYIFQIFYVEFSLV